MVDLLLLYKGNQERRLKGHKMSRRYLNPGSTATNYMETCNGDFLAMDEQTLETMRRAELVEYLEARGIACYDDENTELLRETAIEDFRNEPLNY